MGRAPGPRVLRSGNVPGPDSTSPIGSWEVLRLPQLDYLPPAHSAQRPPRACAPLDTSTAPVRWVPCPRYLIESDCIQGKGTLSVQAAAAMRGGEKQEAQEKRKQRGERSNTGHSGSHNAGFWEPEVR